MVEIYSDSSPYYTQIYIQGAETTSLYHMCAIEQGKKVFWGVKFFKMASGNIIFSEFNMRIEMKLASNLYSFSCLCLLEPPPPKKNNKNKRKVNKVCVFDINDITIKRNNIKTKKNKKTQ